MALVNSFDSIIFDYGGVLVKHQTEADQTLMAELAGIPAERFTELYWARRAEYDKAGMTAAEYWHDIAQEGGGTVLSEDLLNQLTEIDTDSWMQFDEPMWRWIEQLRNSGKRLAILSNMPQELGEALKARTTRLAVFDHVTLSYEVRAVKPEPVIYEECLEGLGTAPDKTLFFDDRIENVRGAELLGIRAIQFLDRDAVFLQTRE